MDFGLLLNIIYSNLGFLDGGAGFVIAFGNFEGTFYRYIKAYRGPKEIGQYPIG